ncbi:hypothetical protein [Candidatus Kuenenia stuttgartiensis]|uniref:hypothetical protein n=1 Tax=Kuenenia stuttgartiensis TaxID=174633 RepID=UPI00146C06DC|nr:hypothetical protein [Candidatus Kuenenia stuttgartiensis]
MNIEGGSKHFGIEVKAPSLLRISKFYKATRPSSLLEISQMMKLSSYQMPKRNYLPRDNPLKDFLISAESKFRPFKEENPEFSGVLVVVWELILFTNPFLLLLHEKSGLFTPNSFGPR